MVFLGIALGVLISVFFILWNNRTVNAEFERDLDEVRNLRSASLTEPVRIPIAMIAQDMLPLFAQLKIDNKVRIDIVGNDASNGHYSHSDNGPMLVEGIRSWLKSGASVRYLIIDSRPSKENNLQSLVTEFPENFKIDYIDPATLPSEKLALVENVADRHPTLLSSDGYFALWLEGKHPRGSKYAYNVDFYSPESLRNPAHKKIFDYYSNLVTEVTCSESSRALVSA
ncbi:hypothetical protein [Falsiphaeobacter marinintestinus]|uniref:hypothetical protein n=1 Tax=Falsiphaeobacter marinintestinus TaxID=1492905 RepID=UPI0011B6ED46|nr:hypothetical protein [Phaeobacter marinintestinus]